ncbi:TonB-dependent receptor [Asaia siamensis]|nr:TonB-dependent receptor [Asaia siamensis]
MRQSHRLMLCVGASFLAMTASAQAAGLTQDSKSRKAMSASVARTKAGTMSKRSVLSNAASDGGRIETVTVTGSALSQNKDQNANPVQIITAREIQKTSAVTIGDYLQRLPSIGTGGASGTSTNTQSNGGLGMSCADLRNLGPNRVLVLVDGKRQVQTMGQGSSCVDLNALPVDQIASVEILKDGGSELYGADAVSGVINIKLKHDLTTGGITVRGGITDVGDGATGKISGYKGFNFNHGRGNISVFGQYLTTSGVMQRNRDWSALPWNANVAPGATIPYGSSITANTRVFVGDNSYVSNGSGTAAGYHSFTNADRYNFASAQNLSNSLQSSNLSGDAHYDVNDHLQLYANVRYSHKTANNFLAGWPTTGASYPSTLESSIILPSGSPYNYWGQDVSLYRRFTDLGSRRYEEAVDTTQVMGGAKGRIVANWFYDASMTYGTSQAMLNAENSLNYAHYLQALGSRQVDPTNAASAVVYDPSICVASTGCSLINPGTSLTTAQAAYLRHTQIDHAYYQMRDFNLRVHNNDVVKLPYQHGGAVGIALGMEHRSEQGSYSPDPLAANGDLGGGSTYTGGGYNATEAYLEGKIPLLQDAFLAKDLTIDGQGRWSHYNTFGDAYNWKVGINWAPVRDIRFRATLGTSFRAPTITELYGGHAIGYYSGNDPCAQASSYGALSPMVVANCAKQGVNTATFVNANSGQLPQLSGGNAALKPEEGRTYTVGTVITPRWIPNLQASVEYWHYTLKNMIGTLPGQYIADECYTGANPSYCSYISARNASGQITQINDTYQNLGGLRTSGIDFDLSYTLRVTRYDSLTVSNNFQQLVSYLQQNTPGGSWYNYAGRLFYQAGGGQPRVRDYATVTWRHNNISLTYMMNYIGGMHFNDGSTDLSCKSFVYCKVPGIFSHDVTVDYRTGRWNFEGGVQNILDKKPPFVPDGATNTALSMYPQQIIGRYVFLQAGVSF